MQLTDLKPGQEIVLDGHVYFSEYGMLHFSQHLDPAKPGNNVILFPATVRGALPADFNGVVESVKAIDSMINAQKDDHHEKMRVLETKKAELLQLSYAGADILDAVPGDSHE